MHIHAGLKNRQNRICYKTAKLLQSKLLASANLTCAYANRIKEGLK